MPNVSVAQRAVTALSSFRFDDLSALLHDDVVLDMRRMPQGPVTVAGVDNVMDLFRKTAANFKFLSIAIYEMHECPTRDAAILCATSFAELSNGKGFYDDQYFMIVGFRENKIVSWRSYANVDAIASLQARLS